MSWAEVKKINSDLSKPLDELINIWGNRLANLETIAKASNSLRTTLWSTEVTTTGSSSSPFKKVGSFTAPYSGTYRFKVRLKSSSGSETAACKVFNTNLGESFVENSSHANNLVVNLYTKSTSYNELTADFYAEKGTTCYVYIRNSGSYSSNITSSDLCTLSYDSVSNPGGAIRSIQYGEAAFTSPDVGTLEIIAPMTRTEKAFVLLDGGFGLTSSSGANVYPVLIGKKSNGFVVQKQYTNQSIGVYNFKFGWQVIEFY